MGYKTKKRRIKKKKQSGTKLALCSARFDLMAKYLYVKAKDNDFRTHFYRNLYHDNINVFNGCYEPPDPHLQNQTSPKRCIEDFIEVFDQLILDIPRKGFDPRYPIPMNGNIPLNGAHRLSICVYFNIKPMTLMKSQVASHYDYNFFKNMNPIFKDEMALQYIKQNKNIRSMIIFPNSDPSKFNRVIDIIRTYGNIYYHKSVDLTENGLQNIIKECYRNEGWIGGLFPQTTCGKAELCRGKNATTIILIDMKDIHLCIELKEKCRAIFGLNKHSLHMSDFQEDTFRIGSALLNCNSIDFLNHGTNNVSPNTKQLLDTYFKKVKAEAEQFCLTSSLILEMFGKRKAKDIDYLHRENKCINEANIGVHDKHWSKGGFLCDR